MAGDTRAPERPSGPASEPASTSQDKAGDRVGQYILLERIGSGGFGVVWRAERREPYVQQVAIKLLRRGMDSEAVLARFEQERQSLALMEHPNIAKVLDGGVTEGGRNFFVMELVKGEPITSFCNRHRLPIERRLRLFAQACDAIQHAHTKGVIHRDLKPGNILAESVEGEAGAGARVKIIDFGVAKATARPLTDRQFFTEMGQMIGTPEYMSPEQADGGLDIDTRTDIYALGVVLYELLVGATPFDPKSLRSAGMAAIHRIIRDSDPPRPSERLRALTTAEGGAPDTPTAVTIAQERSTKSQTLLTRLRDELEWLPMKAMRKDRTERYRSASEFADDIRNYLDGRPLLAGPESAAYRARKFVRRHRAGVFTAGLVAAVTVAAAIVSTTFWLGEARQRRLAEERERQVREVSAFQQDMLERVVPAEVGGELAARILARVREALERDGSVSAEDRRLLLERTEASIARVNRADLARDLLQIALLGRAAEAAGTNFKDQPSTEADLRQVLAIVQFAIGQPQAARALQDAVLALRHAEATARPTDAAAQRALAQALAWSGRMRIAASGAAEQASEAGLAEIGRAVALIEAFPLRPDPEALLTREFMAEALLAQGDWSGANDMNRAIVGEATQELASLPSSSDYEGLRRSLQQRLQTATLSLGMGLRRNQEAAEALRLLEPLWQRIRPDPAIDAQIRLKALNNLALARLDVAAAASPTDDAAVQRGLQELEEAVGAARERLGEEQDETARAMATRANQLWRFRGAQAATEIVRLDPWIDRWSASQAVSPETRAILCLASARAHRALGSKDDAARRATQALAAAQAEARQAWAIAVLEEIANFRSEGGDLSGAIELWTRLRGSVPPGEAPTARLRDFVNASADLAYLLAWNGQPDRACEALREALAAADRPTSMGGLPATSDARWHATNLLRFFVQRSGGDTSALDRQVDELRSAREAHNARRTPDAAAKSLDWTPRARPAG